MEPTDELKSALRHRALLACTYLVYPAEHTLGWETHGRLHTPRLGTSDGVMCGRWIWIFRHLLAIWSPFYDQQNTRGVLLRGIWRLPSCNVDLLPLFESLPRTRPLLC